MKKKRSVVNPEEGKSRISNGIKNGIKYAFNLRLMLYYSYLSYLCNSDLSYVDKKKKYNFY